MTKKIRIAACLLAAFCTWVGAPIAAELSVSPILLEFDAPSAAGVLTLVNSGDHDVTAQVRVFKWTQSGGQEVLAPATDVVASPPSISLTPNAKYTVRIVRTSKRPVQGEESYRVIVDQLPNLRDQQANSVNLLLRQSIPAFFRGHDLTPPKVSWSLTRDGKKVILSATNTGDVRLRLARLKLRDAAGKSISLGDGLLGYVLGQSSMSWIVPSLPPGFGSAGGVRVSVETQEGPLDAKVQSRAEQ